MNEAHLQRLASDEWRRDLERYVLPFALGDLALDALGDDVLEIGPGPGLTTDVLHPSLGRLTAIEIDADLAEALRVRLAGANVDVVTADATSMPFEDRRFSGAVALTMLHHVPTPELQDRLFSEVRRVLRPGALLIAADGVATDDLEGLHDGDIYNPVDPKALEERLARIGFDAVEVRTNEYLWACHARAAS